MMSGNRKRCYRFGRSVSHQISIMHIFLCIIAHIFVHVFSGLKEKNPRFYVDIPAI